MVLICAFMFDRQIPYAIGQFTVNEFCHEMAFRSMTEEAKQNLSGGAKFGISLGSGIVAGFAAAILSQVSSEFKPTPISEHFRPELK